MMHDPIAYTYEADYHCPGCTLARFGRGPGGFIAEESTDREGNPVGAVFPWDEWWSGDESEPVEILSCGTCGGEIDRVEVDGTWEVVPEDERPDPNQLEFFDV